ncbi:MAG TPA: SDR family NAD(P)-dependent oxidoreductase [Beijerinckiaceae bacterium]|jgi:3-oxoacyl-[acyl-carrier protein] reductase
MTSGSFAGQFAGQVAMITGGASGIGRAATLAFARAGAKVAFTYLSSADEAREVSAIVEGEGGQALALHADMTDEGAVEAAFARAEAELGPLDVLFANAGGLLKRERCVDTDVAFWNQAFAVNVTSTFLACKTALKRMEPRGRGVIVTMSSLAAFDGGGPGASHYAASKGAIVTYTRALAKEVGPLGIRVNGVAPGLIGTRFHDQFNTPQGRQTTVERTPLRREGRPEDVADAVLFLASEKASFLAGETIQINGGLGMF